MFSKNRVLTQQEDQADIFKKQLTFYILSVTLFCTTVVLGVVSVFRLTMILFTKGIGVHNTYPLQKLGFAILTVATALIGGPLLGVIVTTLLLNLLSRHINYFKNTPNKCKITILSFIHLLCAVLVSAYLWPEIQRVLPF